MPVEDNDGFTLIELLVVMVVIGLLAAIAIPTFLDQRRGARDTAAKSDLRQLAVLEEQHLQEQNFYGTVAQLVASGEDVKVTSGVTLRVLRFEAGVGYCLSGKHRDSAKTWYYDSRNFGLQPMPDAGCPVSGTAGSAGDAVTG